VTETFLRHTIPDSFVSIDGYDLSRRDRNMCNCKNTNCKKDHKGGGVLIYSRPNLSCKIYESHPSLETLWITGKVPDSTSNFFVNVSYHPPKDTHSSLTEYLAFSTAKIMRNNPHSTIFIGGDFNRLDLSDLEDEGVTILHTPPTRNDATLDILLTNRDDLVENTNVFSPTLNTDHLGIIMYPKKKIPPVRTKKTYRDYSPNNKLLFNAILLEYDFSRVFENTEADCAADTLDSILCDIVAFAFPFKTISISDRDPTWITPKIKAKLRTMKNLRRKNGDAQKISRLSDQIAEHKIKYLKNIGSREWWTEIDTITHRKKSNKKLANDAFDGKTLNEALAQRSRLPDTTTRSEPPSFSVTTTSTHSIDLFEVATALKQCKSTSPGPTDIPAFVFQTYWHILAPLYHHVWNLSISSSTFPSCYKKARLTAIPKTANSTTPNDVRGISVTPISARIFERIVHKKWILPSICALGDPLQFAYKPSQSTADCLVTLQHIIINILDTSENDGVHCITVDFAKAFDTLDQYTAAAKYKTFIQSGNIQRWLYDFSINRSQGLYFNNTQHPQITIDTGCSQGTVGGPNIFVMFTDDLRATDTNCSIIKYSDDSTLLAPCRKHASETDRHIIQNEISQVQKWSERNKLNINSNKTKHIRFCLNKNPSCRCHINTEFETVPSTNILGICFQSNCSFRAHRKRLIATLRSHLYIIRDLKLNKRSEKEIDTVFNALIISKIRYGISTYGSDIKTLDKINHFLVRCHEKGFSPRKYNAHHILEEEDRRLVFNIIRNPRHPLHNYLTQFKKDRSTRHGFTSVRPQTRTIAFHRTFCNRVLPF